MGNRSVRGCLVLAAVWIFFAPGHARAQAEQQPSVLFVAIDDLNDWVGFLGGHPQARTPHLDRLASRGIVFSNAHCAAPLCAPSRAAVFSGKQPFTTGCYNNSHNIRRLHPREVLLPQYFAEHGYRVYGTGKLLHRRVPELFEASFFPEQRWSPFTREQVDYTPEELPSKGTDNPRHRIENGPGGKDFVLPLNRMPSDRSPNDPKGESFDWGGIDVPDSAMGDAQITDWAIERLAGPADRPLFLAVGYYRPHIPLFAPSRYFRSFPVEEMILPPFLDRDLDDLSRAGRQWALEAVTAGAHATVVKYGQWREAVAAYLACVTFVDAQIGRLLGALEESPFAEDTLIVVWGDHGWHLGEKQHWGKWTGWDRSTRVPLLIVPPRRVAHQFQTGTVSRRPASLVDLYPTLIEICNLEPRPDLDGRSLVDHLKNPDREDARAVVTTFDRGNYAVRDQRWRLIRYADGSEELYDRENDPHEWHNLIHQPEFREIRARLAGHLPDR